jgi:hypothetical protein
MINKGLIQRESTIDHWRSQGEGRILWSTPYTHTHIHTRRFVMWLYSRFQEIRFHYIHWQTFYYVLFTSYQLLDLLNTRIVSWPLAPLIRLGSIPAIRINMKIKAETSEDSHTVTSCCTVIKSCRPVIIHDTCFDFCKAFINYSFVHIVSTTL